MKRFVLAIVFMITISTVCLAETAKETGKEADKGTTVNNLTTVQVKDPAPVFALYELGGKKIKLEEIKTKKAIVINFFATWCEPCKEELPFFIKAYEANKEKVQFIGISLDTDKAKIQEFVKEFKITYPVCMDYTKNECIKKYLGKRISLPTTVFIGLDGNIAEIRPVIKEEDLKKIIEGLIKK